MYNTATFMIWTVKFARPFGVRGFTVLLDKVLWYPQAQVLSTKPKADADNSKYKDPLSCALIGQN